MCPSAANNNGIIEVVQIMMGFGFSDMNGEGVELPNVQVTTAEPVQCTNTLKI